MGARSAGEAGSAQQLRPGKFEVVGVNCDGDSEVQGDVFWTMYPKYKLSY